MKRTQIYLTKEEWDSLQNLCKIKGLSISCLIRKAIDNFLCFQRKKVDLEKTLKLSFGIWNEKNIKDSVEYIDRLRKDWQKREKRLGI